MTTRHLIAYGIIALFAAAAFALLWFRVLRGRTAGHRRRVRLQRERSIRVSAPESASEPL